MRKMLVLLFVKTPIGQAFILSLLWGLAVLQFPQLANLFLIVFLLALQSAVYLFSPSIASELLDSKPCTIKRVTEVVALLTKKVKCRPPRIEVCDPMIRGLNAVATMSPLASKIMLTEDILKLHTQELKSVIAHEMGHIKYHHTLKLYIISSVFLALLLLAPARLFLTILVATFFTIIFTLKVFERSADRFAARIANPTALISALLKTAEDRAYRLHALNLIRTGKLGSQEEIMRSIGLKRPKSIFRRLFLWIVSAHPPIYYRIDMLNKLATHHEIHLNANTHK